MKGQPDNHEFQGFVNFSSLADAEYMGLKVSQETIIPLFIFQAENGWGDGEQTSNKFSWVLLAKGTDDMSVYILFGQKKGALDFASKYLYEGKLLDPSVDTYKNRKWHWQN
jgi:hypothetical protein